MEKAWVASMGLNKMWGRERIDEEIKRREGESNTWAGRRNYYEVLGLSH